MRKRNRSPRMNALLASQVKALWQHTTLNQAQIAAALGALNQGRVCEVVNNQRYRDVPPADLATIPRNAFL